MLLFTFILSYIIKLSYGPISWEKKIVLCLIFAAETGFTWISDFKWCPGHWEGVSANTAGREGGLCHPYTALARTAYFYFSVLYIGISSKISSLVKSSCCFLKSNIYHVFILWYGNFIVIYNLVCVYVYLYIHIHTYEIYWHTSVV